MMRKALAGVVAGAAGTTALNAVTYMDMVLRGRGASSAPEQLVDELSDRTGVPVPGEGETRKNRASGTGAVLGMVTGTGVGMVYGLSRALPWRPAVPLAGLLTGLAAMAGSDVPMATLKVSDPRTWKPADWLADIVPHLTYGIVTAAVYEMLAPACGCGRGCGCGCRAPGRS
ncbi:hypothetical protein [Streptomyces albus]|uniref:hypothetical protein n=1 Tax=Streptomyces sp. NRRL F-5639 TaxID=1463867 RepID=UPI0007C70A9D|nr:hypothetical protein [Streptomyces sp. NRRL F-5639]